MSLTLVRRELPATPDDTLKKLLAAQKVLLTTEQVPIPTDHVLHAGMYSRTVTMPQGVVLMGALVRVPTVVITVGAAKVYVGGEWQEVKGYNVLPAKAHRKQIFVSQSALIVTMLFPTQAKTVEEAEREFTEEADLLLSRRQECNTVRITGDKE